MLHTTFFTHNAALYCLTHKECFHHPTPEPHPPRKQKLFDKKMSPSITTLRLCQEFVAPHKREGGQNHMTGMWSSCIRTQLLPHLEETTGKSPLLFRCNDQQTERSNQQVLPQQKSTIPPLIEHKLSEYLYLNHKSSYIMLCLEKKTRTLERAERRMNQTTLHKQRA
jgi:hypothetical protein